MSSVTVQFLGSGEAFGSGGRFQTCIYVHAGQTRFLIDCGASSLVAMKRYGVDPGSIDVILVSHLHGDHFGGIPFLIRETQIASSRSAPLLIAGPKGIRERTASAMEILFPGSSHAPTSFNVSFCELREGRANTLKSLSVYSYRAIHTAGTEAHSLRVECDGRIVSYSRDTEWNENLIEVARLADLFICECFTYEKHVRNHMNYRTLMRHQERLSCKQLILTHFNNDLLEILSDVELECAEDGKILRL
jgi:ribonuclease BN (tRNA processing enzyme)